MALKIDILRADDLLNLAIECDNLKLDSTDPEAPVLVPVDPLRDSHLIVTFPPQTIGETAFFEIAPYQPPASEKKSTQPDPAISQTPNVPIPARLGRASRLVFVSPAAAHVTIPYTLEGLLQWAGFKLNVSPSANVPENPRKQEIATAGGIHEPERLETAIELPYRVILSPTSAVRWLHSTQAVTHNGRTELWHTRLALPDPANKAIELTRSHPAPLRAIWSPDYNPNTAPAMAATDPELGLTAMSPYDRHSVVVLTSAFNGYVNEDETDYLPLPIHAEQFILSPLGGWLKSRGNWDPPYKWIPFLIPFRPQPFDQFIRSTLLDQREIRHVQQPLADAVEILHPAPLAAPTATARTSLLENLVGETAIARFGAARIPMRSGFRGDPLSLSEWIHIATLGRDHYVRIVYEGHLYPFGHRAALIKITERQIRHNNGSPLAYLVQHMFIVVREPVKDYTGVPADPFVNGRGPEFAHYDRHLPWRRIRLTTLVTPDIAHPATGPGHIPKTDFSTWVMVNVGGSFEDFKFHGIAEDIEGNEAEFTASLVFIPFSEQAARGNVYTAYAMAGQRRACGVPERRITFAPRDNAIRTDNTTLVTKSIIFHTFNFPFNKKYGGFLPTMVRADVRIPAVEHLLGKENVTTTIALTAEYRTNGLVNAGGVFAQIVKENPADPAGVLPDKLPVTFQAKQAGGVATPNLDVSCLSRQFGTLAGDVAKAASNNFDPASFFPKGSAQLFGVLDLSDLIRAALSIADNAPKTQISTENIPGGKKVVTRLEWEPKVQKVSAGILAFIPDDPDKTLKIHAILEKPVKLPPAPPEEGSARFSGELTGFSLDFANVILIKFKSFNFTAEASRKMEVNVALDSGQPVKFQGDLDFVEKLREVIPPGLLGDGPSLDINAERIRAGFSIALPPLAVGVFALKDVSLSAALELPFADGKPTFDFAFCERHHPFCLTVSLLGGGGFFHLQLDTGGIKQLEAALEFGAVAALDIGVASGSVHIMAGIYFGMQKKNSVMQAQLTGYFRAGGELSVLGIVSVSVEFNLSFTYYIAPDRKCKGRASLTVTISIAFFSISVELSVEKSFGAGGGDPTFAQLMPGPAIWDEYAGSFA